ncbi:MAG: EutN/CcmL family microcompartment protein [Desulfobacterales bacterium]|nr:EutN/CcmL family microcompartment protein [Desulfobacterales bacterium]
MIVGKVVGNVWATRKEETLNGLKFMIVVPDDPVNPGQRDSLVAIDQVGAGIGETVLVAQGSSARKTVQHVDAPVDAAIVGIIDEMEVRDQN